MLFGKNKLDKNLEYFLKNNCYKKYRVLIKYEHTSSSIIKKISYAGSLIYHLVYSKIICANLTSKLMLRLLEYPEVKFITFDEYLFLCGMSVNTANNTSFKNDFSLSGNNIGIGIIDSGVFPHPDLTSPSNRIYSFTDLINNLSYPYDDNGHGTCIAGIISGNGQCSKYLIKNNHIIIERNFRSKKGEIDIISKFQNLIIFTEVKSRFSKDFGLPCEAITRYKINNIKSVASYFLYLKRIRNVNIRFDVIEIFFNYYDNNYTINHIENAF